MSGLVYVGNIVVLFVWVQRRTAIVDCRILSGDALGPLDFIETVTEGLSLVLVHCVCPVFGGTVNVHFLIGSLDLIYNYSLTSVFITVSFTRTFMGVFT